MGKGPPILRASHWLSHVTRDMESPVWLPWLKLLSADNRYICYDQRGCGLSEGMAETISFDAWLADLEAVADTIDGPFTLLGMSQGGALSIAYAARHPDRVSRLMLFGAYGRGGLARATTELERLEAETLVNLVRLGWGRDLPAFNQVFTNLFIPGGSPEQHRWWHDLERITTSPEVAARAMQELHGIDVMALAADIAVPTVVFHSRNDARVPFEEGRRLASAIAGARFVPLDSANHVLLDHEPSWPVFRDELRAFMGQPAGGADNALQANLTRAEAAVLALVAEGLDNPGIAAKLGKSEKTVRNQVSVILEKLGVRSRSEAIVAALRGGVGQPPRG